MPTLRTGGNSPFGRKARIAVKVLGLEGKVALAAASTSIQPIPSASRTRSAKCRCCSLMTAARSTIRR